MPPEEDQLSLRQADQIRGGLYGIQDDLDFIKVQLARLPTRNEVWRAAMLGMLGGAVAAVILIEAFARSGAPRPCRPFGASQRSSASSRSCSFILAQD
jgi:hypothetical protein